MHGSQLSGEMVTNKGPLAGMPPMFKMELDMTTMLTSRPSNTHASKARGV